MTISSPDARAASYGINAGADLAIARGQDPCTIPTFFVCPATLGGPVTVTRSYVDHFVDFRARAFGRNQARSPDIAETRFYPQDDDAAFDAATRWPVSTSDSTTSPTTVADAHGGAGLRVAPALTATDQVITPVFDGDPTIVVPSIAFDGTTTARTTTAVVDTTASFSVAVVLPKPTPRRNDMTVFDQPGVDGSVFSLVLTADRFLRWCVTTTDAVTTCVGQEAMPYRSSDFVVARFDAPGRRISLASTWSAQPATTLPGTSGLRAASGGIRFGVAGVPGTIRYRGLLGSPLVARGWIEPDQVRAPFLPAA